jgi:glycosyltransferase involved in cell wall biosynthesis
MDLVADMLLDEFGALPQTQVEASRVQPGFCRVASRFSADSTGAAWNADRLINRVVFYPKYLTSIQRRFDVFHVVDHSYAQLIRWLPRQRSVVTCHDLDAFRCLIDLQSERRPIWFRAFAQNILAGFRRAAHVVCVSQTVREEALQYGLIRPDNSSVVYNGVHPSCTPLPVPPPDNHASALLPFSPETLLLLHVGSTIPRKRIDVLLRVFHAIRGEIPAKLIRVGGPLTPEQSSLARNLGVQDDIVQLPFLDRDVLAAVYRRSSLLLITSEREGFGLPIAEAMACGCPVIATDLPVLREIGGSAAEYVPLQDESAWRNVIRRLLSERESDPAAWQQRKETCIKNAGRFTWTNTARDLVTVYKSLL